MEELLKRWADLEPKRCEMIEPDYIQAILPLEGGNRMIWGLVTEDGVHEANVQYAAQKAIEARGLSAYIKINKGSPKRISKTWPQYRAMVEEVYVATSDTSPAEALLAAYIQALESIQS